MKTYPKKRYVIIGTGLLIVAAGMLIFLKTNLPVRPQESPAVSIAFDETAGVPPGNFDTLGMSISNEEKVRIDGIAQDTVGELPLYREVRGSKVTISNLTLKPGACSTCYRAAAQFTDSDTLYTVFLQFEEGQASVSADVIKTPLGAETF